MNEIAGYLSIAGTAHRLGMGLRERVASDGQHFPHGDQTFLAAEIATCEAVVASMQAVFAMRFRILEFSWDGKAVARIPLALVEMASEEEPTITEL